MSEIIELATRLGKAIADSPQAAAMQTARKALESQGEVVKAMQEYNRQAQKIQQLSEHQKPIEPEDKKLLEDLHGKLISSDIFKNFQSAQVDFMDLMRQVSQAVHGPLEQQK